jgi:DNA repair photolyase
MRIPIQIGPHADPFQPAEKRYKATKKTLKLLREHNYPYMIITKGGKILDQYVKYLRDGKCVVHISISTQDPEAIQLFEPKAPPPTDRINSIKKLADNKITVQHRLWPILPLYNTTKELENLIKTTTRAGAKAIIAEYLRIFNYHHFKHWLGLEYIKKLKQNKIPYTKNRDHYKIQPTQQDQKLREIKKICEKHNTPLYSPTILHYNHHQTCCGTDPHLHNRAEWALQLCHHKIGKNTTYNEYITGTKCPYPKRFQRFWDKGKLEKSYYDVKFNQKNKTYTHNKYDDKQVTLNV